MTKKLMKDLWISLVLVKAIQTVHSQMQKILPLGQKNLMQILLTK